MNKIEIPSTDFELNLVAANVKAAMKGAEASSSDLWKVHPSKLRRIEGFNGRIRTPAYLEHLASIKNSIRENGYYPDKPLAGFVAKDPDSGEEVIYVTEGHTRFDAVDELIAEGEEFASVPVVIKPKGTTMEDLTVALVTSNDGRPFTTYEKALMVKRLHGMGMDEAIIAKRLGFKTGKAYVDDLLMLAGAPKAIRELLIADKITATMAIDELKKDGSRATARLKAAVTTAEAKGKTRASPKHLEKPAKAPRKAAAEPQPAPGPIKPQVDAADVLADAKACGFEIDAGGFVTNLEVTDGMLLKLVATSLNRVGAEVYATEDPASDL